MCERIAEFVVECTVDGDWLYPTDGGAVKRRYADEIVRCRDCFWFNEYHGKCHCTATIIDTDGNVYLTDEENGYMSMTDAEPDGFCAWGVRRADA